MSKAYNEAMKEAMKEYKERLKDSRKARLEDRKRVAKIRKATMAKTVSRRLKYGDR